MKKLKKLKLNSLAQGVLNEQEMNVLRGGASCSCCCGYANYGGSSTSSNSSANSSSGYTSSYGCGGSDGDYTEDRVRLMSTGFCAC
jgi:natural product precursor